MRLHLPLVNDAYESLTPYVPGKPISETERELGITGLIKLASNENLLGASPKALAAVQQALTQINDYPDGAAYALRARLAAILGVQMGQLIVGNGTNEIIDMVIRTCVRTGDDEHMLYVPGSFIAYKLCAQAAACQIRDVPMTTDGRYDLPALVRAMDGRTKLVFIANPNNPTGTYVTRAELDVFFEQIPDEVVVVLDEAYFEYAFANDYPNGLDYLARHERLLIMRTFSKCYGLAGLRVGYGVGSTTLIDYLNRGRLPFNVNSLGQVAALAALDDHEFVQRTHDNNREQLAVLRAGLQARGMRVWDSQANFVLVDLGQGVDGNAVFERLLRAGVIVRPMHGYGMPSCLRISIGLPEHQEKLLRALDVALQVQG